ncbi:MAG: response regulator [Chloroflexi bacterium]|nr:response regulator [Chloroflexota bacterium]MCH7655158.1 response regulator [Chloroflexota bacterium]
MSTATKQRRRVVLLVEDDRAVRRVVRLTLEGSGYDVVEAEDGTHALERLERGGIDAVVLDLGLPDARAPSVLAWLHAHDEKPPWLVISAVDRADAVRLDGAINGRFVAKPFDPWELLRQIAAMAARDDTGEDDTRDDDAR